MAWKKTSTSTTIDVDVDADDLDTAVLLQALINRGCLREREAEAIAARRDDDFTTGGCPLDDEDFDLALDEIRRGRRHEALIHLERALGGDFVGHLVI